MTLVSQTEYAKLRGVSHTAVYKWAAAGKIVFDGKKVNVEASNARLSATAPIDREAKGSSPPSPPADNPNIPASPSPSADFQLVSKKVFDAGKAETAHFSGKLRNLEYKEKAGKLGSLEEIHDLGFKLGRMLRDQMTPWSARLGAKLGLNPEQREILEKEVADVLDTIDSETSKL